MRSRRGRHEGAIYRRADGVWCAALNLGYGTDGKRRRRYVYGATKQEVQEKLQKLQGENLVGGLTEPSKLSLAQYLDRWLEDAAKPTVRASTYVSYQGLIESHIKPHVGSLALQKASPLILQSLYTELEKRGHSGRTQELVHAVLHKALKQAVRWGLLKTNPCDGVVKPKWKPKRKPVFLNEEQSVRLLEAAKGDRLHAVYVIALSTGLRQGEIFGLEYGDINLDGGTLTVQRQLNELRGKLSLGEPKTTTGKRVVRLPQIAIAALRGHMERMLSEGFNGPLLFVDHTGNPLRKSNFRRRSFQPILKRAKLGHMRFHDLRHTSASLALARGVNPKVVQEMLGHAKVSFTLSIYSHVLDTIQGEAAAKMNEALTPKAPPQNDPPNGVTPSSTEETNRPGNVLPFRGRATNPR